MTKKAENPLLEKPVDYVRNWKEWKTLYEKETKVDILLGLLHQGFDVRTHDEEERTERISLYLEIANGAYDYWTFRSNDYNRAFDTRFGRNIESSGILRQILSQKAYHVLCQYLFKNTSVEKRHYPSWAIQVAYPQILAKIIWFFRLDENGRIFNLSDVQGHDSEVVKNFLREFACFPWKLKEGYFEGRYTDDLETRFSAVKPSMIKILFGLRELDFLLKEERYKNINEGCEKEIEKLALSFEMYLPSSGLRKPRTVNESCLGGSLCQAAQTLILLRIMKKENNRLTKAHRS